MSTTLSKVKISGYNNPDWVIEWINNNSGIVVTNKSLDDLIKKPPSVLLTYEKELLLNTDKIFQFINKSNIKNLVVITMHLYLFDKKLLEKINNLSAQKNVTFLSMGSILSGYKNIKCYAFDVIEHAISNDFNFLLSCELKQNRNPVKDFAFFVHMQDDFRKFIWQELKHSEVFKNSLVFQNSRKKMDNVENAQKNLYKKLSDIGASKNITEALKGWVYTPNLKIYEQIFCEIVIESQNQNPLSDLSEKTYRPISLNIPFVFLGQKQMFAKLINDGYKIIDNGFFYKHWHSDLPLKQKLPYLIEFLTEIKKDVFLRKKLEQMANDNYQNFWTKRKLHYITNNYNVIKKSLGNNLVQQIYSSLNF